MMNLLSQDLLFASKMQGSDLGLRVRPHSVARLLKEVSNVAAPIARLSGVRLQVARVPEGLQVRCDRDQVLHAMASLVVRVARATRQGGTVTLSAEPRSDTVRFVLAPDAARVVRRAAGVSKTHGSSVHTWLATTLIESQGGRVWSGKAVGRDSHIYFTMPSARRTAGRSSEP